MTAFVENFRLKPPALKFSLIENTSPLVEAQVLWAVKDQVLGDWSDAHKMDYGSHKEQVMKLKFDLYNLETLCYQKI